MTEPVKILIIDDNEDDRMLYRRTLSKNVSAQYAISEASEGEEGLNHIRTEQPACVLLDYSLPGHNGIEVLKRIRTEHPFVAVVMLTGQGNEKVAVEAMQYGAQNYISKSTISRETLEHVMRMAIEHCALQKRIYEQRTSLEVFTRALAHDLKEPVRTIRTFIELVAQFDTFPEKAKTYFHHIQNAADRMYMLIDTVFLYTRLDDPGQMPTENCDVARVLKEVEENLAQLIQEHSAKITHDALPTVNANHIQLTQVLQNLLSNAIHHGRDPIEIRVSAKEQQDHWVLSVKDNGPGINEEYFQKIFEPFKRLVHHEVEGAGLGLATCKKIVEAHGGKIWCESKPGEGATFLFTLPKAVPSSGEKVKPSQEPAAAPHRPSGSKQLANVLLVDDNKADIDTARFRLLERSNLQCNFFVARGGEEALAQLHERQKENETFDLVLLDINMPEMDGFEVLERIRSQEALKDVSVVMCTGSMYDKDMEKARTLGAAGYLTKPIEFANLQSIIKQSAAMTLCEEKIGYSLLRAA